VDRRQLIPHASIGVAACLGAYMMLVDGPRKELATARAEVSVLAGEVQVADGLNAKVPELTAALDRVSRRAESIAAKGRPARDERSLYAAITALAAEHRVRLDELNPTRKDANSNTSATPTSQEAGKPATATVSETAVGYSMVAIAAFDDLAGFVASMRTDLGFSCIRSVRITPVQDERVKLVRAVIETEHYSFETTLPGSTTAQAGGH
jgi:hypothetical protein